MTRSRSKRAEAVEVIERFMVALDIDEDVRGAGGGRFHDT